MNEIASSFVSLTPRNDGDLMRLLPRNDAGNSRIFVIASEAISRNSRFIYDEIIESSRGITQGLEILEFPKIRHCEDLKKEGAISFIKP